MMPNVRLRKGLPLSRSSDPQTQVSNRKALRTLTLTVTCRLNATQRRQVNPLACRVLRFFPGPGTSRVHMTAIPRLLPNPKYLVTPEGQTT